MRSNSQHHPEKKSSRSIAKPETAHDIDILADIRREEEKRRTPGFEEDPLHTIEREARLKRAGQWNDAERDAKNLRELNEFVAKLTPPIPKDAQWGLTWFLTASTLGMVANGVHAAITSPSPVGLILILAVTGFLVVGTIYLWTHSIAISRGTDRGYVSWRDWPRWMQILLVIGWACVAVLIVFAIAAVVCGFIQMHTYFCGKS